MAYFYLHENNNLIFKTTSSEQDLLESSFVKYYWYTPKSQEIDRDYAWQMLCEALALDANSYEINLLAKKWELTNEDAEIFASRSNFVLRQFQENDDQPPYFFASKLDYGSPPEPHGIGINAIEAISNLLKALKFSERSNKKAKISMFSLFSELSQPLHCYQCMAVTKYLFPDSRCSRCTRITPEELVGISEQCIEK